VITQYPPPKVIAVDVDGTLHTHGSPNARVIAWCRRKKAEGYSMLLWSSRGQAHAEKAAELFGVADIFDHIISKPGFVLDDQGWNWIRFTRVIRHLDD
jgi:FMN phosphatase YigB (HAD superfamily)